jgi:uncharacterized membrane protein required for colicin V production
MLQSLILDALIVLILLLLAALGAYRGGLRELCTAAGLLLGVAIVSEWAPTWGNWVADKGNVNHDAARFIVAVATLVSATMVCGYGAGAAFSYRPGPGGRMYGAILGLMIGVVFVGYVINYVRAYLNDGDYPKIVRDGYVARAFSQGLDWVLLVVAGVIVLATAFGLIVREDDVELYPSAPVPTYQPMQPAAATAAAPPSARSAAASNSTAPSTEIRPGEQPTVVAPAAVDQPPAVRVREGRSWEQPSTAGRDFASGWSQTWPGTANDPAKAPWEQGPGRSRAQRPGPADRPRSSPSATPKPAVPRDEADVLREWLAEGDDDTPSGRSRPRRDE